MIYCLTGKIMKKSLDSVVISCGGCRLFCAGPATTGEALPARGAGGDRLYHYERHRERCLLYGFANEEQRDCLRC